MKKTSYQKLEEKLSRKKETAWGVQKPVFVFAAKYMEFLEKAKTERAAARQIMAKLKKAGFAELHSAKKLAPGDKVYLNQKDKSVVAAVIGKNPDSLNIVGAHLDSPRLDIKPNPLYEEHGLALMKSHYYGGIKKYQWTNVDLALYGVVHTKKGKFELTLGEKTGEPRFIVSDLLPHLARKQLEKSGNDLVEGEQLNIYVGNIPVDDEKVKHKVKLAVLEHLNRDFGLVEEDFAFAELQFVPAGSPAEIGFDKSMISAYGHDDKACSYATLQALLEVKLPKTTAVAYFSDKEEIGSYGNTGAHSYILLNFAEMLTERLSGRTPNSILRDSKAISADVSAAIDPSFSEVFEEKNSARMGNGIVIEKYTGAGGKYNANDASAEYMDFIRKILDKNKISYQAAEIGKVDMGGGGTIALYLSRFGMDIVDAGPAVLGMHAPREVLSKVDLYESYRLYKAFFMS